MPEDVATPVPDAAPALNSALRRNIEVMEARRREDAATASMQDRVAGAITRFTGSMIFVYLHLIVYGLWIFINLGWFPGVKPFDPTFVILASEASVEAIFLSTFVLISQNRMAAEADKRAQLHLHFTLLCEHELTRLTRLVEKMAVKMGLPHADPELDEIVRDVEPEAVLDAIARHTEEEDENGDRGGDRGQ